MADGSCFAPMAKGAMMGIKLYYKKFEKCFELGSSCDVYSYMYDPKSQVSLSEYERRGSAFYDVVTSYVPVGNRKDAILSGMVRPPENGWSMICRGKFGEMLCIVTEHYQYTIRDDAQCAPVLAGNVDYYDVVHGSIVGSFYSVSSRTSLVVRDHANRMQIGMSFVDWLNEEIYGEVEKHQRKFEFNQAKLRRLSVARRGERRLGDRVVDMSIQARIRRFDDLG